MMPERDETGEVVVEAEAPRELRITPEEAEAAMHRGEQEREARMLGRLREKLRAEEQAGGMPEGTLERARVSMETLKRDGRLQEMLRKWEQEAVLRWELGGCVWEAQGRLTHVGVDVAVEKE